LPTGYAVAGTLASLAVAVVGVTAALTFAAGARGRMAWLGGGAMLGISVAAMHATGMQAFRTEGTLSWRPDYLLAAVVLGIGWSMAALAKALSRPRTLARDAAAAGLLAVGIVCLHFISMAAVTVTPNALAPAPTRVMPDGAMALTVSGLAGLIMLAAVGTLALEAGAQRRSRQRLAAVIHAMPDGLAYFDSEDRFVLWNRRYEEALAVFDLKPVLGARYVDCVVTPSMSVETFSGSTEANWAKARMAQRRAGANSREESAPDGKWYRVLEAPTDDGGRITSVVDITDLKRAAEELETARDEAEAANRAKSAFLANMSHEIRTPLNGVLGVADALALTPLSAEQGELVEIIRSSGGTLNRLLCDILDLARVESGALDLVDEPFHLGEAVRDAARLCAPRAAAKGLDFKVAIDPAAEGWVQGDATRLKQIVTNLAANAVKFTETGRVEIGVAPIGQGAHRFRITVTDTGPGFDEETRSRLFGRFQQADGSIGARFGGSGLGLSISRELVELMGGAVEAESLEGVGSRFVVELPLPRAEAANVAAPAPAGGGDAPPIETALRVLVADDHPNNRRLMASLLGHLDAECVMAEDGAQAVAAWEAGAFDVILMDMQMPGLDGLGATRRIREMEAQRGLGRTPILIVSANAMPEHVAAGREAGADGHLAKPLSAQALFKALAELADDGGATAAPELAAA
ncbi:MAG: response regulator, partial [Proteobacteria bacterium]|nr:response regulator [Pseudomonadota bacterium]